MSAFNGVVLAGGKSSRMGTDKALLTWQGKSWLAQMVDLLTGIGAEQVVVSRNVPCEYNTLEDKFPDCGPLGGIHAAMCFSQLPVLIVPVDVPAVSEANLHALIACDAHADIVAFENSPLPCFVRPNKSLIASAADNLQNRKNAVGRWMAQHSVCYLSPQSPIVNFNSPEDLDNNNQAQFLG